MAVRDAYRWVQLKNRLADAVSKTFILVTF